MKKIKIVKDDNISIFGCLVDDNNHKRGIGSYEAKIIILKLNEIIERLNDLGK